MSLIVSELWKIIRIRQQHPKPTLCLWRAVLGSPGTPCAMERGSPLRVDLKDPGTGDRVLEQVKLSKASFTCCTTSTRSPDYRRDQRFALLFVE